MRRSVIFQGVTSFEIGNIYQCECPRCCEVVELKYFEGEVNTHMCKCGVAFTLIIGEFDLKIDYPDNYLEEMREWNERN